MHSLHWAVCLWMVSHCGGEADAQELRHSCPQGRGELWTTIRRHLQWQSKTCHPVVLHLCLVQVLPPAIMCNSQQWKRATGIAINSASICTWRRIFDFWQGTHMLFQDLTSVAMFGQKKQSITNLLVALTPGWDKPCSWRVMDWQSWSGTNGQTAACDILQMTSLGELDRHTFCLLLL